MAAHLMHMAAIAPSKEVGVTAGASPGTGVGVSVMAWPGSTSERAVPAVRPGKHADDLGMDAAELEGADAEAIVAWTFRRFERVALVASFQAEAMVLIDMASRIRPGVEVLTVDTGRLPEETHDLIEVVRRRFSITLRTVTPEPREVEAMVAEHGVNLFYLSPGLRHLCCGVRKIRPLARALLGYDVWMTGLRRGQAASREGISVVSRDESHGGIIKVAPLAGWSHDDVWGYVGRQSLPTNALYGRGYTSIGCAPCTRAPRSGEHERAGRWWWEADSIKECGLHPPSPRPPAGGSAPVARPRPEAGAEA